MTHQQFYELLKEKLTLETGGSEYIVSPENFESILDIPDMMGLLKDRFNVCVVKQGSKPKALLPNGDEINLNELYMNIESDAEMRDRVYQIGMSIWR